MPDFDYYSFLLPMGLCKSPSFFAQFQMYNNNVQSYSPSIDIVQVTQIIFCSTTKQISRLSPRSEWSPPSLHPVTHYPSVRSFGQRRGKKLFILWLTSRPLNNSLSAQTRGGDLILVHQSNGQRHRHRTRPSTTPTASIISPHQCPFLPHLLTGNFEQRCTPLGKTNRVNSSLLANEFLRRRIQTRRIK